MVEPGTSASSVIPTISVSAAASIDAVPDEARIGFDLSADGRSASTALDAVRQRLDEVDKICDELEIPNPDRSSTVSVSEQGERDGAKWLSKGYTATANIQMEIRAVEVVGPLVTKVVAAAGPRVSGPYWRVSPDHPARLDACAKAGAQAKGKAEAYAAALEAGLGPIVSVNEGMFVAAPVQEPARPQAMPMLAPAPAAGAMPAGRASRSRGQTAPPPEPVLDLHPGTHQIRAEVSVVFRIEDD